jgi:hypothetical protein
LKIIIVCYKNHAKEANTPCSQNLEFMKIQKSRLNLTAFFFFFLNERMVPMFEMIEHFLKQLYILDRFVITGYPCRLVVTKYSSISRIGVHAIKRWERFITLCRIVEFEY